MFHLWIWSGVLSTCQRRKKDTDRPILWLGWQLQLAEEESVVKVGKREKMGVSAGGSSAVLLNLLHVRYGPGRSSSSSSSSSSWYTVNRWENLPSLTMTAMPQEQGGGRHWWCWEEKAGNLVSSLQTSPTGWKRSRSDLMMDTICVLSNVVVYFGCLKNCAIKMFTCGGAKGRVGWWS